MGGAPRCSFTLCRPPAGEIWHFSAGRRTASIWPPGVSPVLWCNHGALIMTAASVKKSARVTFEPNGPLSSVGAPTARTQHDIYFGRHDARSCFAYPPVPSPHRGADGEAHRGAVSPCAVHSRVR